MSSLSSPFKGEVTPHDRAVLNRIFNPNLPYGDIVDETNGEGDEKDIGNIEEQETPAVLEAKRLEVEGVKAAEGGDIDLALSKFSQAIALCPSRASGYNNRAQGLRLKGDVQGAFEDLNKAIELSNEHGDAACQAYTQRGLINKLEGHEDKALEDFKKAANLGGQFARQQVIAMNPYAALCNQMMSEMFRKVKSGEM